MKVQSVNSVNFSSNVAVKPKTKQTSPSPEEDLHFQKGERKIMRRAFALSAILFAGAITYFKSKF